ncbi:cholinesterase 1-like [Asterias rubens]|uniref:cholinesterase 1-like n=1 Tax=Asterias rubens TaxID=7604 RepID=UPI0014558364|nr:cholinesterase 1-like [Asterias rubens]
MAALVQLSLLVFGVLGVECQPRVSLGGLGTLLGETVHYLREGYPAKDVYIDAFRGIPFAEKPVRFSKPRAKEWSGEFNATTFKERCPQALTEGTSEDCLYLNVWAPNPKPSKAAVMVFIHGGGYVSGAGDYKGYHGTQLVAYQDVVVVTCNYRLGSFGFLTTGDPELPGNYGLWDQREALKWVKAHITAFGGDSDRITIFGQSAGAGSVSLLTLAEPAWEFFDRAIVQSGQALCPWSLELDKAKARQDAFEVGRNAGCGEIETSAELAECLRVVDTERLNAATTAVLLKTRNVIPFVPTVDGELITDNPLNLFTNGKFKQCDIMTGAMRDEGTILAARAFLSQINTTHPMVTREEFESKLSTYVYRFTNDMILDSIKQEYYNWADVEDPDTNFFWSFVRITTDEAFVCPIEAGARAYTNAGMNTYLYHMTYVPSVRNFGENIPWVDVVAHSDEITFVFGHGLFVENPVNITAVEMNMTLDLMRYWTNFAKTGNPNLEFASQSENEEDETNWAKFSIPELAYKDIAPSMKDSRALRSAQCQFWNEYLPKLNYFIDETDEEEWQWREEFYGWKSQEIPDWRQAYAEYMEVVGNDVNS